MRVHFIFPALCLVHLGSALIGVNNLQYKLKLAALQGQEASQAYSTGGSSTSGLQNLGARQSVPTAETVQLPLDHWGDAGNYTNRFWVQESYYKAGGPVFVFDAGEGNAEGYLGYLVSGNFFSGFLQEFNGMGLLWEHRYYGESAPYEINDSTPSKDFQYLTYQQALADIPYFAANFSRSDFPDQDLTPKSTPWIFVGGSYPGLRAAYSRHFYPDTFYAAWADSAPVEAQVNMSIYWEQVWRGMNANGWGNCTNDLQSAYSYIDAQLANPNTSAALKVQYLGQGADNNTNGDFTAALSEVLGTWQSYGVEGGNISIRAFCDYLETDPSTGETAPAQGWGASKGGKYVSDRWSTWPAMVDIANGAAPTNCKGQDASQPLACDLGAPDSDGDSISWTWQYCTQFGYLQYNNYGPHHLLSSYQDEQYQQDICYRTFPDGLSSGYLPSTPNAIQTDQDTTGWNLRPSNTYEQWSAGQYDPWRTLSALSTESFAPQGVAITQAIPAANISTSEDDIFGFILPNSEHCFDFYSDTLARQSQGYFTAALKEWLPVFSKR
ncbi:MAG: hypothetical protein M1819_005519 [Sarea resinae]|nr:MAG: hypothetical protein M1819_005519 [Sarea resinae]